MLDRFGPTENSSKIYTCFNTSQKLKIHPLDRQGLDLYADVDGFWHAFFHHFCRPPTFHNLQQVKCQTAFFSISGPWFGNQKSITATQCFFHKFIGPCFLSLFWFSTIMVELGTPSKSSGRQNGIQNLPQAPKERKNNARSPTWSRTPVFTKP